MKVANLQKIGYVTNLPRENYFNRNMRRLKRAAVITALVGIGIFAGVHEGMAQLNYDKTKLQNPVWVKQQVDNWYSRPERERVDPQTYEERDRSIGFGNVFVAAKLEVAKNQELAILKEALKRLVDKGGNMSDDAYGRAFMNVYIWFLDSKSSLSPFELRAATDQKIAEQFKGFLKEAPQKQPEQPVAVKLTLGQ